MPQRLFHVRRHTRRADGSFEWCVLNRHSRRASKNFKNSAAAEARRAQLQATFDRHSRLRTSSTRFAIPSLRRTGSTAGEDNDFARWLLRGGCLMYAYVC